MITYNKQKIYNKINKIYNNHFKKIKFKIQRAE